MHGLQPTPHTREREILAHYLLNESGKPSLQRVQSPAAARQTLVHQEWLLMHSSKMLMHGKYLLVHSSNLLVRSLQVLLHGKYLLVRSSKMLVREARHPELR